MLRLKKKVASSPLWHLREKLYPDRLQCVQGCESSLQGRFTPLYALQATRREDSHPCTHCKRPEGKIRTLVRTASDPKGFAPLYALQATRREDSHPCTHCKRPEGKIRTLVRTASDPKGRFAPLYALQATRREDSHPCTHCKRPITASDLSNLYNVSEKSINVRRLYYQCTH